MTSDVRRDTLPRSSQCGGGDVAEPTAPALECRRSRDRSRRCPTASCLSACGAALRELGVGEESAIAVLRRPLERHAQLGLAAERALQIRIAPRRLGNRRPLRGRRRTAISRGESSRHRDHTARPHLGPPRQHELGTHSRLDAGARPKTAQIYRVFAGRRLRRARMRAKRASPRSASILGSTSIE